MAALVYVLLSGGIDSTTTLAIAAEENPSAVLHAVNVRYGQRHIVESECARWQADCYDAEMRSIDLHGLTGLLVPDGTNSREIPNVSYADLPPGISPTYVSFRNGSMLAAVAAMAQGDIMSYDDPTLDALIYIGTHADDAANDAYPDCTPEFIGAMSAAIWVGTYRRVRLRAPLLYMNKPDIISRGTSLNVDYSHTWSCYKGEKIHCGVCPTCRARKEGFELAGVFDPTEYAA